MPKSWTAGSMLEGTGDDGPLRTSPSIFAFCSALLVMVLPCLTFMVV